MIERYEIELEAEVRRWLESLPPADYLRVMKLADFLADHAETLGEPQARHLGGKLRDCGSPCTATSSASRTGSPLVGGS
jgi:hypothetical protein